MSSRRKFTTEFKVEAAHRVIDSGRSIAEVARELSVGEQSLGEWVRDERRRMDAARGTENEPLTPQEKAELATLRKKVVELEKDLLFLGKVSERTSHRIHQGGAIRVDGCGVRQLRGGQDGTVVEGVDSWLLQVEAGTRPR